MDSKKSILISILLIQCLLICFFDKFILSNCKEYSFYQNKPDYMLYREFDLSEIDLDLVLEKSEEWSLDFYEMVVVLAVYQLPFAAKDFTSKKTILSKKSQLLRLDPTGFEFGKTFVSQILQDIQYFPVPIISFDSHNYWVQYIDSFGFERTYGGKRVHEGTDLMGDRNERSFYPILSVCDGIVEKKGWLEKGGYRIGIRGKNGCYYYYAHLAEYADIKEGDAVKAGQLIGFMGDTGYGVAEGTKGLFDVHLHFGIYFTYNDQEYSINPYWVLKNLENKVLSYNYDRK